MNPIEGRQFHGRPRVSFEAGAIAQLQQHRGGAQTRRLREIFPRGIPIVSVLPEKTQLQGGEAEPCYFLDAPRLTEEQLERVADSVIEVCRKGTRAEVIAAITSGYSMPVRASLIASTSIAVKFLV